jgi:hypothetical protein
VWRLFRTLRSYYPSIEGRLAFAVLFMPSSLFWGSGIIKDTFTFSAVCWFVHLLDELVFRKRGGLLRWAMLLISAWVMVMLKPYVFMALFPATMLWVFHARVQRIRNQMLRVMVLPLAVVTLFALWFVSINALGDELGKFSLDRALDTIVITQADLKRGQYGTNYFDLGPIEPTWSSVLSKFPVAVLAGLFRPAIFEVNNVMMLFSGLENLLLASLAAYILFRSRVVHFFTLLSKNALLQMAYVFAVGYAFMIGVTTPNFGAMVRFKIPLLPLFVSALFISAYIFDRRREAGRSGMRFRYEDFRDGEPGHAMGIDPMRRKGANARLRRA